MMQKAMRSALYDNKNRLSRFAHQPGNLGAMLERANPSCKDCHGTGKAGSLILEKQIRGKISQQQPPLPTIDLTCACVMRATNEKVPWLQKHGIDNQPWLQEEKNEGTGTPDMAGTDSQEDG